MTWNFKDASVATLRHIAQELEDVSLNEDIKVGDTVEIHVPADSPYLTGLADERGVVEEIDGGKAFVEVDASFSVDPVIVPTKYLTKVVVSRRVTAEKMEYGVDLDMVEKQATADAKIAFDNPETQRIMVEVYSADMQKFESGGQDTDAELEKVIDDMAGKHFRKSMPNMTKIFAKYPTAKRIFEARYLDAYSAVMKEEVTGEWLKTRPPEMFSKLPTDDEISKSEEIVSREVAEEDTSDMVLESRKAGLRRNAEEWLKAERPQVKKEHELSVKLFNKPFTELNSTEREQLTTHVLKEDLHTKESSTIVVHDTDNKRNLIVDTEDGGCQHVGPGGVRVVETAPEKEDLK